MESRKACCGEVISFAFMLAIEGVVAGGSIISKAAMSRGVNSYVFVVYYYVHATIMLLPCFIFYRSYGMIFAYTSIDYSSPALYSAVSNLAPAFVFILATLFRQETLDIRNRRSQAKILGTIVSVTGATMVTLYKGQPPTQTNSSFNQLELLLPKSSWTIGSLYVTASSVLISVWFILQTIIAKEYPAVPITAFLYCFFAMLHCHIYTDCGRRRVWRLRHGIEYIAVTYSAIVGAILSVAVHTWYLHIKGPIYVSIFKPLGIVFTFIMSVIVLGDKLYTGSMIGSVVITIGFYGVLWGKYEEEKLTVDIDTTSSLESNPHVPLLGSSRQ